MPLPARSAVLADDGKMTGFAARKQAWTTTVHADIIGLR